MRTLKYILIFTVLTAALVSCSKNDLAEDGIFTETDATGGED